VESYVSGLAALRPNARVLPVFYFRTRRDDCLSHAIGYKGLEMDLIDWDNYEARISYFPVCFRDSVPLANVPWLETAPESLRLRANRHLIDAVYTWRLPSYAPLRNRLSNNYERVSATRSGGELWLRRRRANRR